MTKVGWKAPKPKQATLEKPVLKEDPKTYLMKSKRHPKIERSKYGSK